MAFYINPQAKARGTLRLSSYEKSMKSPVFWSFVKTQTTAGNLVVCEDTNNGWGFGRL
jgi:hypothetical protein